MLSLGCRYHPRLPLFQFSSPARRPTPLPRTVQTTALRRFPRNIQQEASPTVAAFIDTLKQSNPEDVFSEKVGKPRIRNQVLFVAFGSLFAFTYAATRTNLETDYWAQRLRNASSEWIIRTMTSNDLKRVQNAELIRHLREWFAQLNKSLQTMPALVRTYIQLGLVSVVQPYADASEGKRVTWKVCLLNAGVYLAWKIKAWQPAMAVRFMHNPLSGLSYTLLTSMFSHKSFFHLLLNCLALESFGTAAYFYIMNEQGKANPPMLESTSAFHFVAFFVSAGMFSGLVSHIASTKLLYPRIIKHLSLPARTSPKTETWAGAISASSAPGAAAAARDTLPRILPSLGASGAIYAALTTTALGFPNSEVALFFPPSHPINIQYAVCGILALDTIGIVRRWRLFDHWAHLGGAAFGVMYYAYGPEYWNQLRRTFDVPNGR